MIYEPILKFQPFKKLPLFFPTILPIVHYSCRDILIENPTAINRFSMYSKSQNSFKVPFKHHLTIVLKMPSLNCDKFQTFCFVFDDFQNLSNLNSVWL